MSERCPPATRSPRTPRPGARGVAAALNSHLHHDGRYRRGRSVITLTVDVPATSPVSVNNTAKAWGGGDLIHTSLSSAVSSTDMATVIATPTPLLAIAKSHSGTFAAGSTSDVDAPGLERAHDGRGGSSHDQSRGHVS